MKQQRCESEQFIEINDNLQRFSGDFISNGKNGKESETAERQRERVCVCLRARALLKEEDNISK